jgi:Co/Zn/Cd efflux system component
MRAALFLTLAFVVGEAVAAYFAHSLALLSDAGHAKKRGGAKGIAIAARNRLEDAL